MLLSLRKSGLFSACSHQIKGIISQKFRAYIYPLYQKLFRQNIEAIKKGHLGSSQINRTDLNLPTLSAKSCIEKKAPFPFFSSQTSQNNPDSKASVIDSLQQRGQKRTYKDRELIQLLCCILCDNLNGDTVSSHLRCLGLFLKRSYSEHPVDIFLPLVASIQQFTRLLQ